MTPLTCYRITVCGLLEIEDCLPGVTHALSILDPDAAVPAALLAPARLAAHEILRFHDIDEPGLGERCAEAGDVARLLALGAALAGQDDDSCHLLVHCHAGISRSTAAAAILLAQFNPGRELDAFREIARLRPVAVPNPRLVRLADRLLARRGGLIEALAAWRLEAARGQTA